MAKTHIKIERNHGENNLGVLRRFRNRVRSSQLLNRARKNRFHTRPLSEYKQKESKLRLLEKRAEYERLAKLGKISER